jgi:hypothetical protein
MDFPQYRKRFDNKSYYKLLNERTMQEVQRIGEKSFVFNFVAEKYFEIIHFQDILTSKEGLYIEISEGEYNSMLTLE